MESTIERGPEGQEEEFTKRGESYIVTDGYVEGFHATITPREGFFDLEVWGEEYLNTRELTVDNVRTVLGEFKIDLPDKLANGLTEWQEKFWDGNGIESDLGAFGDRLTPEEIEMAYGPEGVAAPEETGERLRLEFGSALAEARGIAEYESQFANLKRSPLGDDHAQEQSLELEDEEDHSFSF
jgi:hypothetical protein